MTKDEMRIKAEEAANKLETPIMRDDAHWPKHSYPQIYKAGVLPYRVLDGGKVEYYLFKPASKMPEKGDPGFQIGKGTREILDTETGQWGNYYNKRQLDKFGHDNLESVKVTAIREGIEEIGLKPEYINSAGEWGQAAFESATTGELKTMWLYPLEMKANCEFGEPDAQHSTTVAREWFDLNNHTQVEKIRPDHLQIIREIDKVIRKNIF